MSASKEPTMPRLVEVGTPKESWVDGFGNIESLGGGVYRIPVYKVHRQVNGDGPDEHEIVFYALVNLSMVKRGLIMLRQLAAGILDDPRRLLRH